VALRIPEILRAVLGNIGDDTGNGRAALAAAARVCRLWSAHALDILWQQPSRDAFHDLVRRSREAAERRKRRKRAPLSAADIADEAVAARSRFYAAKVRRLQVTRCPQLFSALHFPQLREARLRFSRAHQTNGWGERAEPSMTLAAAVEPFVSSPRLERLEVFCDEGVLALLLKYRPQLRELAIMGVAGGMTDNSDGEADNEADVADDDDNSTDDNDDDYTSDVDDEQFQHKKLFELEEDLFDFLSTDCATTLEKLIVRGISTEIMPKLVTGLFAWHATLAELVVTDYCWRVAQLEQIEQDAQRQAPKETPFRALTSLSTGIAAAATPRLLCLLNATEFRFLALRLTDHGLEDESGADIAPSNGGSGDATPASSPASTNEGATDAGVGETASGQDGEGANAAHRQSAWDVAANAAVASMASFGRGLRVLELSFFRYTFLRRPALMSLCALTGLEKLSIYPEWNSPNRYIELQLNTRDFVALLAALGNLRHLKLSHATGVTPRWLLLAGQACPLLESLELPEEDYDIDALTEGSHAQTPLFPHLTKLRVYGFAMTSMQGRPAMYVNFCSRFIACVGGDDWILHETRRTYRRLKIDC
jgi:hypothetical protein